MRTFRTAVRALSALGALGTVIAIGVGINALSQVDWLRGCNSPTYPCPPESVVSYQIDPSVPQTTLHLYIAALVLMLCASVLIVLLRNLVGAAIAVPLTFVAGLVFIFGQFWYIDIEPGFSAEGTQVADLLGLATLLMLTVLLVLEIVKRDAKRHGQPTAQPSPPPPSFSATASGL